jgi:hypothetical protein
LPPLPPTSGNDSLSRVHTPAPRPHFLDVISAVAKAWAQQTGPQPHPRHPSPPTHPAADNSAAAAATPSSPATPSARGKPKARENNPRDRGSHPPPGASPYVHAATAVTAPSPTLRKASPGRPAGHTTWQTWATGRCEERGGECGDGVLGVILAGGRGGGGGPGGGLEGRARWRVWSGMRGAGSGPSPLTEGLAPAPPPPWAGFERPIGPGGTWEGTMVGTGGGGPPWRGEQAGWAVHPAFAAGRAGPNVPGGPPRPRASVAWGGGRRGAWSGWDAGAAEMGRRGAEPAHQPFSNEAASVAAAAGG